jgi:CP family cyanate transporter-like MFS transporter
VTKNEVKANNKMLKTLRSSVLWYMRYVRNTPRGVLLVAIFLLGFIMRAPISAIAPIAEVLADKFDTSLASVGALSGIPLLCFAMFAPVASYLIGKKGLEFTLLVAGLISAFGVTLRAVGSFKIVVLSTVLIGMSIGLQNICVPLLAARDFPRKFTLINGINSVTMSLGQFFATALTTPLVVFMGVELTLLSWLVLVVIFLVVWLIYVYRKRRGASRKFIREASKISRAARTATSLNSESFVAPVKSRSKIFVSEKVDDSSTIRKISKLRFTYSICLVFSCQCFSFFGLSAWLPSIFQSLGMDPSGAGVASSIAQLFGILGSICVVPLLKRLSFTRTFIVIGIFWIILPLGLLFAPRFWLLWLACSGIAQAANYIITFSKISAFSRNQSEIRKFSAVVQMVAYTLASLAPSVVASIHDCTGDWTAPLWSFTAVLAIMLFVGVYAHSRQNYSEPESPT